MAAVAVDVPLAHLDRPFDYLVPAELADAARVGCRVRVRFAGRLVGGYLLHRRPPAPDERRLAPISRLVSPLQVLTPSLTGLARRVADHYAGTLADVLRLAVPPRHAAAEREFRSARPEPATGRPSPADDQPGGWADYPGGPGFLAALGSGGAPRAVCCALPGNDWPDLLAGAAAATLAGGRTALVVAPDGRDAALVDAALRRRLGDGRHLTLTADLGPAERYRRWLTVLHGRAPVVVGTRAAMFAPLSRLGLVVVWDDGDDAHAEPRAPYPHARDVLLLRAHAERAAALVAGFTRTAEGAALVRRGWAESLAVAPAVARRHAPAVRAAGDDAALARDRLAGSLRLPQLAFRVARAALAVGPVLVQVPRRGYLPALACRGCRRPVRCRWCAGPLAAPSRVSGVGCRWCGRPAGGWECPHCGSDGWRAVAVGARRTAEELGRAFPGCPVRTSGGDRVLPSVDDRPALVVATPGAEPSVAGGYPAALLLDGAVLLGRPQLRAAEEALRRWVAAAALVRPGRAGGRVVVVADPAARPVQALLRWDPVGHADRELDERVALRFPPATRLAALTGTSQAVAELLAAARLPPSAELLGPVSLPPTGPPAGDAVPVRERTLVRVPRGDGEPLAAALAAGQAARTARKAVEPVRVQLDPVEPV